MNKVYEETDKYGKHKVIEQPNGVKIRILKRAVRVVSTKDGRARRGERTGIHRTEGGGRTGKTHTGQDARIGDKRITIRG